MINQVNIKTLFLVAMSAVIILILSYMNFSTAIHTKVEMKQLKNSIELSTNISELVHSLQRERGLSIGYLSSKGQKFSHKLKEQIEITNQKFQVLEQLHSKKEHDHNLYKFLDKGLYKLNAINQTRKKVFDLSINESSTIDYYTNVNSYFLSAVVKMTTHSTLINVTGMLVAYANLLYLEEYSGQERALVISMLLNKTPHAQNRIKLNNLIVTQNIYKDKFSLYADNDTKKVYNKALVPHLETVQKIRALLLEENIQEIDILPSYWFTIISAKIDSLKEVDTYFMKKIIQNIDSSYDTITKKYYFNIFMGILALILGIGSFIYFVIKENKRLSNLKTKNYTLKLLVDEKTKTLQEQKYELEILLRYFDKNIIFSKTDMNGVITHVSEAFCKVSGYTSAELLGKPHNILRHQDMTSSVFQNVWDTIKTQACWFGEIKNHRKDDSYYWIYAGIEPDYDHSGKQLGFFAVSHDITAKKALEIAMQTKSDFLANMSHEIRTPLNAIMGFVDILHKDEIDASKMKKLEIIKDSGVSLLTIINDILDFSKIENNKLIIEKIPFDIKESFTQTSELFFERAKEYGVTLTLTIDEKLPQMSLGDVVRLKQVVSNLLSNAIKFSPQKSTVHIKVSYQEGTNKLLCEIIDKGIGIAPDKTRTIFESFTQEDSSTTRKYGGTGLGLSISKALIELMDGEIGVKSTLNKGSTFYFTLPLYDTLQEIVEDEDTSAEDDLEALQLNGHILIVEDNKANQMLMKLLLDDFGLDFSVANDGVEAVEMVQKEKFDLILMDENMPNMNGIEATKQIRQLQSLKDVPIIAVTANALKGDKEKFLEAGMDNYLAKPIDAKELKKLLKKYLFKEVQS